MAEQQRLRRVGWEPDDRPHSARQLPRLVLDAAALVWAAGPRLGLVLIGLQIASSASLGVVLLVVRGLVGQLLTARQTHISLSAVLPALGELAALLVVMMFAGQFQNSLRLVLTELVTEAAFQPVAGVATAVDLEAYDSPDFQDRMQRALNAAARPFQITQALMQLGGSLTALVGLVTVLLVLQPLLVPTLLLTLVPLLLAGGMLSSDMRAFSLQYNQHERRRYYVRSLLTGKDSAKEVRAYGLAGHFQSVARQMFEQRIAELWQVVSRGSLRSLLGGGAAALAVSVTIGVLTWFVLVQGMSVATATAAAIAIVSLVPQVASLAFSVGQLYESALFLEDLSAFRALLPEIRATQPVEPAPERFRTLSVDDVRFTYPGSERQALAGVSLRIERGEVVALVGENGSGKTTLAKVLSGLYQPQGGQVCWDGVDVSQVDAEQLRGGIAVVFQDFGRYLFSVAENVGLGRVDAMDDRPQIERASRQAGAHEFVARLPRGYDTMLGKMFEEGEDLSTGQWQRIALARAFFRDAPFVILDEPTAALDARAEHELFESIRTLFAGRTVLLISHRFSSVLSADRIFVLAEGRVVEQGTHAELMATPALYAELFTLQAQAYRDG